MHNADILYNEDFLLKTVWLRDAQYSVVSSQTWAYMLDEKLKVYFT